VAQESSEDEDYLLSSDEGEDEEDVGNDSSDGGTPAAPVNNVDGTQMYMAKIGLHSGRGSQQLPDMPVRLECYYC